MFVQSNKVSDLKKYFVKKLENDFSANEIKLMFALSLEKRLNLSKEDLFFLNEIRLSESDLLFVRTIAHRLLENEPFHYILGETEFFGLKIICDKRALIPRPETEELVAWICAEFPLEKLQFIDFCSGSGCIALALKSHFSDSNVLGIDISEDAITLSKENALLNKLELDFQVQDVLNASFDEIENESIDCIVSNPPYIPEKDKLKMHENVLNFEPHLALFVENENPFIFYEKITQLASKKLKKGGKLFFEIHEDFAAEIEQILRNYDLKSIEVKEDLQGKKRMVKAIK